MKVALVYDRVNKWGGAERVLLALNELFPDSPLYTSVYSPKNAPWAKVFPKVIPSYLQKLQFAQSRHEFFPLLMPHIFESFNFENYDLVISITSEAAKGIITKGKTKHICYLLTPTRYLWSGKNQYFKSTLIKQITSPALSYLKKWDKIAAQRPDQLISISKVVQKRAKKYYKRDSQIIYPPVDVAKFKSDAIYNIQNTKYFLVVSRLVPYKKVDLVIETFNKLGLPLIIVGTGSEEKKLRQKANNNIKFMGHVTDKKLANLYRASKALIFPQLEDFGITAVEAMAVGKPVIAYNKGGARDTLIDGKTGIFFDQQKYESLAGAVSRFAKMKFDNAIISTHAQKFSKQRFKKEFLSAINKKV